MPNCAIVHNPFGIGDEFIETFIFADIRIDDVQVNWIANAIGLAKLWIAEPERFYWAFQWSILRMEKKN